jgi:2-polyprenyl-3-methyl-5-hydroxy-6-metoxy-1,4-benzoquinol methylase
MNNHANSKNGLCPLCFQADIFRFITIDDVPVHCNVLRSTRKEAVNVKRAEIALAHCRQCDHIFNLTFEPQQMDYGQQYENSLHYSPHFQKYAGSLAQRLVKTYNLYGKTIMEIGCGRGDFLNMLCELGDNSGIGFEPSYQNSRGQSMTQRRLSIIRDFYSDKYTDYCTDFIVCRHVLEHIDSPRSFIRMVRATIGSNAETVVFFEVPNIEFTLRDLGIWDLIYEHYGYFSQASLSYLFSSSDFVIHNIEAVFGGQFICLEASLSDNSSDVNRGRMEKTDKLDFFVRSFSDRYDRKVNEWQRRVKKLADSDKKTVVWGAGSKGISFLNQTQGKNHIKYIVDVNPYKHGKFIAGGGQEIVPPDFLKRYGPDIVIVMNHIYHKEIQQRVNDLGLTAKLVLA